MDLNRRDALGALGALSAVSLGVTASHAQDALPQPLPPSPLLPRNPGAHGRVRGRMTGAQAAVAALHCEAVRCVFGVPGAQNNEFWDAMKSQEMSYLLVTNEASSSVMADAVARVSGEVGVFAVVPGPGLTNAMTGIGEALHDSVPIVGLVTDVLRGPGAPVGQVHGLNNAALLRPICKAVFEIQHQGQIPGAIHQAFHIARCGEPGPTAVVLPYNFLVETWDYDEPVPPELVRPFDEAAYRQALRLLSDRRARIGIYAGMGCANASPALTAVAELLEAPVATSVSGKGVISDAHPLAVGWGYGPQGTRAAEKTFKDVDVVLAVGVKYSEVSTANYSIPDHHKVIHVDANPNNLGKNLHSCVNVLADSQVFFERLLADAQCVRRAPCPDLRQTIHQRRHDDRCERAQVMIKHGVDPMVFLHQLRRALCRDAWMFVDVTASVHWAAESLEVCGPRRFFTPANNQSMGWAVPAAVGAQRIAPHHQVVSITGDGCFLMSGLEASTAARDALPVKFFVLDDGAYHYMQMLQEPTFGRTTATEIAELDYASLARGLRLGYNCIGDNADIEPGIARSLSMPGPVLTRVAISYDGRDIRWLKALRASYIDHLSTRQKAKLVTRATVRAANPLLQND